MESCDDRTSRRPSNTDYHPQMLKRQTSGSVICTACGVLVGVQDATCYNCGRRNPGMWGFGPALRRLGGDLGFVPFVMGASVVLYALTLVFTGGMRQGGGGLLSRLTPNLQSLFLFGASGAQPVFGLGRWWTLLSATWLHAGALHIFFNMYWVRQLAPATAELFGPGRMVIIYTAGGVAGFALSSFAGAYIPGFLVLRGSQFTVGASASIFGLLGALVYYGRRTGSRHVSRQATSFALFMGVFGLIMPGIDNYAHAGGFGGGYLLAVLLDPLKPERVDHLAIAVVCLAASMLAIVVSVFSAIG
jgi:rhomboid protease GluP